MQSIGTDVEADGTLEVVGYAHHLLLELRLLLSLKLGLFPIWKKKRWTTATSIIGKVNQVWINIARTTEASH